MSYILKKRSKLTFFKFEAEWEVIRAGVILLCFLLLIFIVFLAIFNLTGWFETLFFDSTSHESLIFLSTVITLFTLRPLQSGTQSIVDTLFFPDTANLKDNIAAATRTLTEINTRQELQDFLIQVLPNRLHVNGIFFHEQPQSVLQHALTLPLNMGQRSMGYLTIGPKKSGRSFSFEERGWFRQLQDQVSLVLSGLELAEARKDAEKAAQLKIHFLTNISHELRTPLNSVINSTGLVADGILGEIDPEPADFLNRAVSGSEYLLHLLDDILDITKIESGELTLKLGEVDFITILNDTLSIVRSTLQNKNVELKFDIADNLPMLMVDRTRIRQVLLNLLSNAVKFTTEGFIWVRAWEKQGTVFIGVEDTGIGIAPENLSLIFEDYQQVSPNQHQDLRIKQRRHAGTGLGMPITKALVELHGGHIWVESEQGKGSIFTFTLPPLKQDTNNGHEN